MELQEVCYQFLQGYIYYYQFHRHLNRRLPLLDLRVQEIDKLLIHLYRHRLK